MGKKRKKKKEEKKEEKVSVWVRTILVLFAPALGTVKLQE